MQSKGKLHAKTLELLRNRPRNISLLDISGKTGLTLEWLKKFHTGKPDSAVSKVEKLYEHLSEKSLKV